jgi:hypothetical protein
VQQALLDAVRAQARWDEPSIWLEEHNLAITHAELGDHERAGEMLRGVAEKQEQAFGPAETSVLRTKRALARSLRALGRPDAALEADIAAHAAEEHTLAPFDPLAPFR